MIVLLVIAGLVSWIWVGLGMTYVTKKVTKVTHGQRSIIDDHSYRYGSGSYGTVDYSRKIHTYKPNKAKAWVLTLLWPVAVLVLIGCFFWIVGGWIGKGIGPTVERSGVAISRGASVASKPARNFMNEKVLR